MSGPPNMPSCAEEADDMHLRALFSAVLVAAACAFGAHAQDLPQGDLVGTSSAYTVADGDNLSTIARNNHVGFVELLVANPSITSPVIKAGQLLVIPGQHLLPEGNRTGVVINLAALRLFRFAPDGMVATFAISVGREGWDTPTGVTTIIQKREHPAWNVPASIRARDPNLPAIVPPGPDNPLGQYALTLGWPGYLIHGTNAPSSIGKPASHGCIRMYPEDIQTLFGLVDVGESVTVVDTPFTLGQSGGSLYLQVTPTRAQAKLIAAYKPAPRLTAADAPVVDLLARLAALKTAGARIDDSVVDAAVARHDGIPVMIGTAPAPTPLVVPEPESEPPANNTSSNPVNLN